MTIILLSLHLLAAVPNGADCFIPLPYVNEQTNGNIQIVPCDEKHSEFWRGYMMGQDEMRRICLEGVDKAIEALHGEP